ncbi:MAG: peptidylprolyl isomerase [Balneolaceae bacterium]|nr:peptidylprolyl isomerase [Balneolaceae bacterium]
MADPILNRDANQLYDFISHPDHAVASLAVQAMAKSQPDDNGEFLSRILEAPASVDHRMWFVLSLWQLDEETISVINEDFQSGEISSPAVCEVFYRQGDEGSLEALMDRPDLFLENSRCALALSTLMVRAGESLEQREEIIMSAFKDAAPEAMNLLLYGFYRGASGGPVIRPESAVDIIGAWTEYGVGIDSEVDKYVVRILGAPAVYVMFETAAMEEIEEDIQLSVEIAKIAALNLGEGEMQQAVDFAMGHSNPHVQVQFLESIRQAGEPDSGLLMKIENQISKLTRNDEVFMSSLRLLLDQGNDLTPYLEKLEFYSGQNPYLFDRALPLFQSIESADQHLERLLIALEEGGIRAMHAMRALFGFWMDHRSTETDALLRERIRLELERGNRSVISMIQPVLLNEELIPDSFEDDINEAYQRAREEQVIDNAAVLRQVLEDRFPDRVEGMNPLDPEPFRVPDWQQLYDLGTSPHWILETEKGEIMVRMDPLSAPFTVASIDSLTRAGLYDDVVFHRVVRNFVIQGGDYDREDGYGGPDYRIPTEPSLDHYERGSAGIASSGTDTEGSQFFFMHERAPHLDGNYTLFGEVVRGMDVVDRIQIGDKIIRARISIR